MLRQLAAQDTLFSDLVYASRVTQAAVGSIIKRGANILRESYTGDFVVRDKYRMLNDVNTSTKQSH